MGNVIYIRNIFPIIVLCSTIFNGCNHLRFPNSTRNPSFRTDYPYDYKFTVWVQTFWRFLRFYVFFIDSNVKLYFTEKPFPIPDQKIPGGKFYSVVLLISFMYSLGGNSSVVLNWFLESPLVNLYIKVIDILNFQPFTKHKLWIGPLKDTKSVAIQSEFFWKKPHPL